MIALSPLEDFLVVGLKSTNKKYLCVVNTSFEVDALLYNTYKTLDRLLTTDDDEEAFPWDHRPIYHLSSSIRREEVACKCLQRVSSL